MSGANVTKSSQGADDLSQSSIEESFPVKVPVVRKLKPPPEIWELVHPVPPKSTSGGAFISRIASSRSMFILLVGLTLCVGGYVAVRSGQRLGGTRPAPVEKAKVDSRKAEVEVDKKSTQESNVPAPVVASSVDQTTAAAISEHPKRRASQRRSNSIGAVPDVSNRSAVGESVSSREGSPAIPGNQKTKPSSTTSETAGAGSADAASIRKSKASLSPQLIESPKTEAPRKSKVIQWP